MSSVEMPDQHQRLFLIFKQAIDDERRAQEMYTEAADITDDPVLHQVFVTLLKDEQRHEQEMVRRYEEFRTRLGL